VIANSIFSLTLPLCKSLQLVKRGLSEAVAYVESVLIDIEDMRININQTFKGIFQKAENILQLINEQDQIKISRLVGCQKNRTKVNINCPEEYFLIVIDIPFYNVFIQQLKDRFSKYKTALSSLYLLIPIMCGKVAISTTDLLIFYIPIL